MRYFILIFLASSLLSCAPPSSSYRKSYTYNRRLRNLASIAYSYLKKKDYYLAIQEYNKVLSQNPYDAVSYNNRGYCYAELGEHKKAIGDFNRAILLRPTLAVAYKNRGDSYGDLGEHELAIKDYTKAIDLNPRNAVTYNNRGTSYYSLKRYNMAIADYSKAISIKQDFVLAYQNRGDAYWALGKKELAIEDYTKAIELNPILYTSYNKRGRCYFLIGRYDEAISDFNKAIQISPQHFFLYLNRGQAFYEKKEYEIALNNFNKAIELNPRSAVAYLYRGRIFLDRDKYELAIKDFSACLRIQPGNLDGYYYRSLAFFFMGDIDRAISDHRATLPRWSNSFLVNYNLGMFYVADNKLHKARIFLEKAVELNPENPSLFYHLAYVYHLLGQEELALKYIEKMKDKKPDVLYSRSGFLDRPIAPKVLKVYAKEYVYMSRFFKCPSNYLSKAKKLIGSKTLSQSVPVQNPDTQVMISEKCVSPYPNRYLLAVLVSKYTELPTLRFVKNDKILILRLATCFLGVPRQNIQVISDPTMAELRRKIREFSSHIITKDAITFFYYSGHGVVDGKGRFYILPKDASIQGQEDLMETAISLEELEKKLDKATGIKLVMIDACRVEVPWKPAVIMQEKVKTKDISVLFATSPGQMSTAEKNGKNSAFLSALYNMAQKGVSNLDFNNSGYVELGEMIWPLSINLKQNSPDKQKPELLGNKNIPIFPVQW